MTDSKISLNEPIFLISVGKSGTVFLTNIITKIIGWENYGKAWILSHELSQPTIKFKNRFYVGHLVVPSSGNNPIEPYRKVLLYRDPRDYVISYAFFMKNRNLGLDIDRFYHENNSSIDDIIMDIIQGVEIRTNIIEDVNSVYQNHYFDWLNQNSMPVRYEDLIGNEYCGSDEKQEETLIRICSWYKIDVTREKIREAIQSASKYRKNNPTFRKGGERGLEKPF